MSPKFPLSNLRILTVEQHGAGSSGSMLQADMGAEVIKFEDSLVGGDMTSAAGPFFTADGWSRLFLSLNGTKRLLAQDIEAPEQHAASQKADRDPGCRGEQPAQRPVGNAGNR